MTGYLLDENVLRELSPRGNANVRKWIAGVDDAELRLSVATLFEKRRGAEMLKRRDPGRAAAIIRGIANLEKAFADRILPVDATVVEEWTRLLGAKNKDRWDLALAATARVHRLVLVTRNIKDFEGRGARLLNPFTDPPERIEP
ncbi:type II toxin-antitoxin system VapC family toxin [Rhizobium ruizarguesonis]|uniref:type II toxin-antitoxin system VapC family toxin n=1 Tax=Rhizobium ruizarguesonis TaxID=2081791 RepID=UPI001031C825|nr:type II toxin-antitoxin system VapC family toxin [Rhizobium ruizarguesonis]NEI08995.1 PIN domain-containing protein [Rhizobium ruizarguesonis]NEI31684.1 PIN domain-containing protein [Rhizobium ruizarguesonis]TAY92505.1 type II toxin-antitoxin system VapC family toxin [Rhizobium ruizarguesonis]TAZ77282.1 type II toxin-antitoxin system VapC family toxin [Rhizobium ruizarguesonis]TBA03654.1 type II toxin-antitoxin system VapC family toxin [Rhizobium ruizarguesonis]